tara:strand:+ start:698 stop:1537 length:840 start_codon:yes stop_codon:yes gene_type:complete
MIPIKGYATFHTLKHCIVGKAHAPDDVDDEVKDVMHQTQEDLDALVKLLETHGIECYRPELTDHVIRPPISPRDYFAVIGDKLLVGKVVSGYKKILESIDRKNIKWYLGNDISTGNMIRCGDHIHWDVSRHVREDAENEITSWLAENNIKVTKTRHGWHMDGVYSIIKPGVIVATLDLPELADIYPKWDIHFCDSKPGPKPIPHEWGGNYAESNYDVNILSLDEENCVSTSVDTSLFKFLERHKVNPIVHKFRNKEFWDNGIHCVTQDLYREGKSETYI